MKATKRLTRALRSEKEGSELGKRMELEEGIKKEGTFDL